MEEKLIELVKEQDYLYNLEAKAYKDGRKKEDAWNNIGKELGITGDACRRKWKALRDSYKRVKQTQAQRLENGVVKKKTWKYEDHMQFLDEVQTSRAHSMIFKTEEIFDDETDAAINSLNQEPETDVQFDVTIYNEHEVSNEAEFEIENFDLNDYVKKIDTTKTTTTTTTAAAGTTTATNNNSSNATQEDQGRKSKKYDKDALIQEACNEMTSLLQNAKKHFTPPSSNQVFFNSMALQVEEAQLPAISQMRLQQRILELVTMEIINHQQSTMQHL